MSELALCGVIGSSDKCYQLSWLQCGTTREKGLTSLDRTPAGRAETWAVMISKKLGTQGRVEVSRRQTWQLKWLVLNMSKK